MAAVSTRTSSGSSSTGSMPSLVPSSTHSAWIPWSFSARWKRDVISVPLRRSGIRFGPVGGRSRASVMPQARERGVSRIPFGIG